MNTKQTVPENARSSRKTVAQLAFDRLSKLLYLQDLSLYEVVSRYKGLITTVERTPYGSFLRLSEVCDRMDDIQEEASTLLDMYNGERRKVSSIAAELTVANQINETLKDKLQIQKAKYRNKLAWFYLVSIGFIGIILISLCIILSLI